MVKGQRKCRIILMEIKKCSGNWVKTPKQGAFSRVSRIKNKTNENKTNEIIKDEIEVRAYWEISLERILVYERTELKQTLYM